MKFFISVLVLSVAFLQAHSSPVKRQDNDDVMIIPFEARPDIFDFEDGVVDTGFSSSLFPFSGSSFGGFMKSIEDTINNLRKQMTDVLQKVPNETTIWSGIPEGKGNTTSTVKVVNGHKITINETTYVDENDDSGNIFKIKIVDVHPTSEESDESEEKPKQKPVQKDVEETTPKSTKEEMDKGSPEVYEPKLNEIPSDKSEVKLYNEDNDNIETFEPEYTNEITAEESMQEVRAVPHDFRNYNEIDIIVPVQDIETNDVNELPPIDMSNDLLVNEKMPQHQDPDAEIIQSAGYFQPIDISNDVLVNRVLTDSGVAAYNPESETVNMENNRKSPLFQRLREPDPEIIIAK